MRVLLFFIAVWVGAAVGCGSSPVAPEPGVAWLHHTFIRGGPSPGPRGRVALTFEGPSRCTDALLAALAAPGAGLDAVVATVFVDADRLDAAAERDAGALAATLRRLVGDGHGLGVALAGGDAGEALRVRLAGQTARIAARLGEAGLDAPPLLPWRGATGPWTWEMVEDAAERPRVLWSFRAAEGVAVDRWLPALLGGVRDGDIVALPGGEGAGEGAGGGGGADDCAVVGAIPALAAALAAAELDAVTVQALLARELDRYAPLRVVRYRGAGLPAACAAPLDLAPSLEAEDAAETAADRWGLVHREADDTTTVLPLPGRAGTTAELLAARPALDALWATRDRWPGLPACLRRIDRDALTAPVTTRDDQPVGWWVVDDATPPVARSARAIGTPTGPALLPDRADLARFEARQRLPWRLRGIVAGALERLGLDTPLLIELRTTAALLVGARLDPAQADDPVAIRRAIAGYLPVAELSLGEYLFLAESVPREAEALERTARAADGFLRPGPILTLATPGRAPDPSRVALDGRRPLRSPAALVARVLRAGHPLNPGDIVAAAPPAPRGAPIVFPAGAGDSMAAALGTGLARSLLLAMMLPVYLRPGAVRRLDGDPLGVQWVRLAVPAGVDAPATEARPLIDADRRLPEEKPR